MNIKGSEAEKHNIYFVGGEKGGVGKSFFARCVLEYFARKKWTSSLTLIEADPTIADVSAVYNNKCQQVRFSDSKYHQHEPTVIFKSVLEKSVLVNLPSNISYQLDTWIDEMGVLSQEAKQNYGEIIYFFVSDGCFRSIKLFQSQIAKYSKPERKMQHILVLNPGRLTCSGSFHYLQENKKANPFLKTIKDYKIPVLLCPELGTDLQFECDANEWTYTQALENLDFYLYKQRMTTFLNRLDKLFDSLFESSQKLKIQSLIDAQAKKREAGKLPFPSKEEILAQI